MTLHFAILDVLILFNGISCRRTGVPLNIKARKDSHGFDNIDDYFPDSGGVTFDLILLHNYFAKLHVLMDSND